MKRFEVLKEKCGGLFECMDQSSWSQMDHEGKSWHGGRTP